ncbi:MULTISPECIES: hypothetical protein [Deinococcus]|uniref:ASCH domain-containing protein n=1 Tax=Deinococcus rufus TaxID=2136097 RepID=A0ABV7Z7J9_9DEIO|nr:hypothetical protein [Deinococcus sp. AB2017081]WQE94667.1 hypothetical protein U2P90_14825 [Deinococcus sp. AB2017081]
MKRDRTEGLAGGHADPPELPDELYALTLHQPWATAVAVLGKRIENRSWAPPRRAVGQWIAIHAGRAFDDGAADWVASRTGRMTTDGSVPRGAIVALARVAGSVTDSDDMWFRGPCGWLLEDVVPVEPVACRGRQRLWKVSPDVRMALEEALKSQTKTVIVD